ncbi:uncharacterized protein LOC115620494 isoform X2 [Scaptodrosophila lebanonensis]|nr:uncharacterized protein LOC115620494 isoform X2 [Scaptodrosophila lebanonensis]
MDMHCYKELLLWAGLNRNGRHCEVQMLGWYGGNGQGALIHELSPTNKLKIFRDAFYQIKDCCKQFILNQQVHIVQYDLPSTEEDGQPPQDLRQLELEDKLQKSESPANEYTKTERKQISAKKLKKSKKLCKKCGDNFVSKL